MSIVSIERTIRSRVLEEVSVTAIGNSNRSLKELAQDLINASHLPHKVLAVGCFLHHTTVTKLASGKTRNPQADTIERVLRYFETEVKLESVHISPEYQNKRKERR